MPERLHIEIKGIVQGVGFRPYISRLANDLNLRGWVRNTSNGLELEVEGDRPFLERFSERLTEEPPVGSQICQFSSSHIPK